MNKLAGSVIGVIVVAAAGMTGAMYWSGLQAERWYEEALAEGSKGGNVKLSTVHYQRGLFSSQIMTRVEIPPTESGADPSFSIRQTVYHGPWPLAGWGTPGVPMQMTGAVVRATLDSESSAWLRQLAKWYGNQEPVVALSQIAFDGASSTGITMPALVLNDVEDLKTLNYSGLQGQFQVGSKMATVQGNLTVASLEFIGKPEAASDGQPATGSEQVKLQDLALTVDQRQGPFNLLFGETSFKIAELRAQDQTPGSAFAMTGLSVTGALTQQGSQQVAGELRIKADQITADQQSGTGSLHLALRQLDGPTLEKLQQWQQEASSPADDPSALLALMKTLLAGKPEFMLDSQAKMTQGDWQGKLTLNFQDFDEANVLQNPTSVLGALEKGLANVEASKNLVETLLTDQIAEQLQAQAEAQSPSIDPQMLQNMAATQATQQLQGLITDGFIQLDGDRYKTVARFESGKLFVNDKEIPLTPPAGAAEMPMEEPADGAAQPTQ